MEPPVLRRLRVQANADVAAEMIALLAGHVLSAGQAGCLNLASDSYEKWEDTHFPLRRANSKGRRH
jgi:hypothetical protein